VNPSLEIEYQGEWKPRVAELDAPAQEVLGFLERVGSGREAQAIKSNPLVAQVDEYGVVTSTLTTSYGEIFLQAGDGWNRVLWTRSPAPTIEWPWDDRAPTVLAALLSGTLTERRTLVRGRLALHEVIARTDSGEETVTVVLRRTFVGLKPLVALLQMSGYTRSVEARVSTVESPACGST